MTASGRISIGASAGLVLCALMAIGPDAAAQTGDKRAEAAAIADKLDDQAQRIVATDVEHRRAARELEGAEANVAQVETELAATNRKHDDAKRRLVVQAQDAYVVGGSVSLLQYLVRSNSGDEVARRTYLRIVTGQDRRALGLLRASRQDLELAQKRLREAREVAAQKVKAIAAEKSDLDKAIQAQRAVLARVTGELAQLVAAEQAQRDAEAARLVAARLVSASPSTTARSEAAPAVALTPASSTPAAAAPAMTNADTWACIRQLESGNNYATPGGGAYQFLDSTWQSLGYTGTASNAPPAVQDEAAMRLQARSGWSQWTTAPLCGRA